MPFSRATALVLMAFCLTVPSLARAQMEGVAKGLVAHKAIYDIDLVATHSGSQILNISGQMAYEWRPSCDGWMTDHKFKLYYDYADSPGMKIVSDFSTFEGFDGKSMDYTSRRSRDGDMYQEIRGHAELDDKGAGKAVYSLPESTHYDLAAGTLFPVGHTLELIKHAKAGDKFYNAEIFDGSDEDGPVEINSFVGQSVDATKIVPKSPRIDQSLLRGKAWNVRMAVFPAQEKEEESDYEMSMVFHENGIISDMLIEYDDFSVRQKLVALEAVPADHCEVQETPSKKL